MYADWKLMVPYVLKWEGGLSSSLADPAHLKPSPVPDPHHPKDPHKPELGFCNYHTNKGVTWETFEAHCVTLYQPALPEVFMQMPPEVWGAILKGRYWGQMLADRIKSQNVAELLVDFAWGSGLYYPVLEIQTVLQKSFGVGLVIDGHIGNQTVAAINSISATHEKELFYDLLFARQDFLVNSFANGKHLWPQPPEGAGFGIGWGNRLKDFERHCCQRAGWPDTKYDWTKPKLS